MEQCSRCLMVIEEVEQFCPKCGYKLPVQENPLTSRKITKIDILAIILFTIAIYDLKYGPSEAILIIWGILRFLIIAILHPKENAEFNNELELQEQKHELHRLFDELGN